MALFVQDSVGGDVSYDVWERYVANTTGRPNIHTKEYQGERCLRS